MALSAETLATLIEAAKPTSPALLYNVVRQYVMSNVSIEHIGISATMAISGSLGSEWDGEATNDAQACVSGVSENTITVIMPTPAPPQTDTWKCGKATEIDVKYGLTNHEYVVNFCQSIINGILSGSATTGAVISIK